jgi:hypothetical protein
MLIEFQAKNYRSFRENQVLSMVAGRFSEHLDNTVLAGLPGFDRLLRSSVVYGANAAGKTNLLRALQLVQALVVSSATATAASATPLPYDPFKFAKSTRTQPSEFQVTFMQSRIRYQYGFTMDAERIRDEWLIEYVNPRGRTIFERTFNGKKKTYDWKFGAFLKGPRSVLSEATRPNALFLSTAIQLNNTQLLPVFEWFQKRLVVITGFTSLNSALTLKLLESPDGKKKLLPFLREADLGITDIEMKREPLPAGTTLFGATPILEQVPGNPTPNLLKITLAHQGEGDEVYGLELHEESAGTKILFQSAGAWLQVFENGEVLLVDEIDTSLHPLLTRFLIERFHSPRSNPNNAQLIFSTHNTTFLTQDLFRRDQIWFVEKAPDGASKLYPLTDFRPRNDEVLDAWYLRGRYGALPVLDELAG